MYELVVCTTSGEVLKRFDISRLAREGTRLLIGRADDCDVRIRSGAVSRHHCSIEAVDEDEWVLKDLKSTAGTFVDGEKVNEVDIDSDLEVHIGPAILRFESVAARIAAELDKELGDEPSDSGAPA